MDIVTLAKLVQSDFLERTSIVTAINKAISAAATKVAMETTPSFKNMSVITTVMLDSSKINQVLD